MFYCQQCEEKLDWPSSMFQSYGKCEMCGQLGTCSDVPSKELPLPKKEKTDPVDPVEDSEDETRL